MTHSRLAPTARAPRAARASLVLLLAAVAPAQASNGLNLVGFGAESLGLGSADIAVSRDSNAVNINPAGLAQGSGERFDAYLVPFHAFHYRHTDANNDKTRIDNPLGIFGSGAYARQLRPDLHVGIGLFTSGGTGVNYEDIRTAFGTRDDYTAALAISKVATGVAWKASERLSLGAGINMSYSATRQKLFPNTSSTGADANSPADDFYGLRIDGADGISWNARVGLQYTPTDTLTLGLSYASETDLKLRGGTATFNFSALGLDKVRYADARIDGFALAQELGAGLAWQFSPRWLLAAELTWLDWSHALRDATLTATRPNNAAAPATVSFAQALDHKDQYVVGLGLEYALSARTVLRGGVNIAPNPIPNRTLTPTFNLTAEGELALGFAHRLDGGWELASTMQFQGPKKEHYTNPQQPFGAATEDYGVIAFTLQVGRRW